MRSANQILKLLLVLLLLTGNLYLTASAATLTATVDRNQVSTNETLVLTVSYDEQVNSQELDLSGLQRDFEVLGASPQSSSSVSVVNGQTTRESSTTWTITLVPKRQGTLTIPAFAINNDKSQAISITVDNSLQGNISSQPLEVWISANYDSVYPSQQLIVELELSAAANISDLNGPQLIVQGADVEALDQQSFRRVDNGVARQIVIVKYAVFAQQAGELVIPVMTFTGLRNSRRSIFGGARGQQVVARSKQLAIPVRPAPQDTTRQWFPAENVTIRSEWSGDTSNLTVGEPITRTITINARGQRANIIPPLNTAFNSAEYKAYEDQPQLSNPATADGFVGTRVESSALVPSSVPADGGKIELPALTIDWWDVKARRWKQATLAAETLFVTGGAPTTGSTSLADPGASARSEITSTSGPEGNNTLVWQTMTAALILLSLIQFWVIVRLRRSQTNRQPSRAQADQPNEKSAWSRLQRTLREGDVAGIRSDIIDWLRSTSSALQHSSLQGLLDATHNPELNNEIAKLEAYLYKAGPELDISQLSRVLTDCRAQLQQARSATSNDSGELKPLYAKSSRVK